MLLLNFPVRIFSVACFFVFGCFWAFNAFSSEKVMILEGVVSGILDQKIYMKVYQGARNPEDFLSSDIKNGRFVFKGEVVNPPALVGFYFEDPSIKCIDKFIVENSRMSLSSKVASYPEKNLTYVNMELSGSEGNDVNVYIDKVVRGGFSERRMEITNEMGSVQKSLNNSKDLRDSGVDENYKELHAKRDQLYRDEVVYLKELVVNNSDKLMSLLAMYNLSSMGFISNEAEFKDLTNNIDEKILSSQLGRHYLSRIGAEVERKNLSAEVSIGNIFKDFRQTDVDGNEIKVSDLLRPGRFLFIDFWASWCGPCRAENPYILESYEKYHDMGFDVLAVSLDESRDAWLEAIEEDDVPWIHVSDLKGFDSEAARLYGINGIPSNYLLNEKGEIIAAQLRGEQLKDKLSELLGSADL